jgi:hypothetical protein
MAQRTLTIEISDSRSPTAKRSWSRNTNQIRPEVTATLNANAKNFFTEELAVTGLSAVIAGSY